jgi:hypothetical protein
LPGGASPNAGGRPRELKDVKDHAKRFTKEATERLVFWMRSDNARASVAAAVALLDRGWGRPEVRMAVATEYQHNLVVAPEKSSREGWDAICAGYSEKQR